MDNKQVFDPGRAPGEGLTELGRRELCELVSSLCALVAKQAGAGYRGGVFPDNISRGEDGALALGPAAESGWQGQELSFLAPEVFWNGEGSPASDVYSLGLLLYYAIDSGRLPFARDGEELAQKRRMNGESFAPPKAAGRRLGEIVAKATRFQASERYQSPAELKAMLDSCVNNPYLSGAPSAETVFHKSDEELSKVERMMVEILARDEQTAEPETLSAKPEPEEELAASAEEIAAPETEERSADCGEPEAPAGEDSPAEEAPAVPVEDEPAAQKPPVVELREEKNPELQPVVPSRTASSKPRPAPRLAPEQVPGTLEEIMAPVTVKYDKNVEREKKIKAQIRRRRLRPIIFALVLCALLLSVAAVTRYFDEREERDLQPMVLPTPPASEFAPSGDALSAASEPAEIEIDPPQTPVLPVEHAYEIFAEDVSWSEARALCLAKGGHLVVVSDEAEYRRIVGLAESKGLTKIWVGCSRINGVLTWETDETVSYYPWGTGEPSYTDSYDDVSEDYLLLWLLNGVWVYNDSRNDPVSDYPGAYRGSIGYVCEYDDGVIPQS